MKSHEPVMVAYTFVPGDLEVLLPFIPPEEQRLGVSCRCSHCDAPIEDYRGHWELAGRPDLWGDPKALRRCRPVEVQQ